MNSASKFLLHTALVLTAFSLLAVTPNTQAQPAYTTYWAALAWSPSTGRYGYSCGWLSEVNARRVALKNCNARDAQVVYYVGNGYLAVAQGDDPLAIGYGGAKTAAEAKAIALRECRKRTTNCSIAVCVHAWAG
jgi:hypothetical protein